jgi:hypothetical protein
MAMSATASRSARQTSSAAMPCGQITISVFCGPLAAGFGAFIPALQRVVYKETREDVLAAAEELVRAFFSEQALSPDANRPSQLVTTVSVLRGSFVRTAQSLAATAASAEAAFFPLAFIERALAPFSWRRSSISVSLPAYFAHTPPPNTMSAAQAYFERNLDWLLEKFPGEYVAIVDDAVVFHDRDLGEVTKQAYTQYKQRPIFIEKVEPLEDIELPILFDDALLGEAHAISAAR